MFLYVYSEYSHVLTYIYRKRERKHITETTAAWLLRHTYVHVYVCIRVYTYIQKLMYIHTYICFCMYVLHILIYTHTDTGHGSANK